MIPKKLIHKAMLLQFKCISVHDKEMFDQGVQCAEILMKDIATEFANTLIVADKSYIGRKFEDFIREKYGE